MRLKIKKDDSSDGNIFWVTMTDLMTGLVLVFIVLFFYTFIAGHMNEIRKDLAQEQASKVLQTTLKNEKIEAQVDPISGVVKISDLELFDLNSYTLSNKGKAYLDKFAPAYFDSLFTNDYLKENLDKIVIQGHTDSQTYKGDFSKDEQYMKNMNLSMNRAYNVAEFIFAKCSNKNYQIFQGNSCCRVLL